MADTGTDAVRWERMTAPELKSVLAAPGCAGGAADRQPGAARAAFAGLDRRPLARMRSRCAAPPAADRRWRCCRRCGWACPSTPALRRHHHPGPRHLPGGAALRGAVDGGRRLPEAADRQRPWRQHRPAGGRARELAVEIDIPIVVAAWPNLAGPRRSARSWTTQPGIHHACEGETASGCALDAAQVRQEKIAETISNPPPQRRRPLRAASGPSRSAPPHRRAAATRARRRPRRARRSWRPSPPPWRRRCRQPLWRAAGRRLGTRTARGLQDGPKKRRTAQRCGRAR